MNARLLIIVLLLAALGCNEKQRTRRSGVGRGGQRSSQNAIIADNLAITLNELPDRIDTRLSRERKILDATNSADGQPILATCSASSDAPGAPINFLQVPRNNANFKAAQVKAGDLVRYYIKLDQESLEHGIEDRSYESLTVRRLDDVNPENALLLDQAFQSPILAPERIEIWRSSDRRMKAIRAAMNLYLYKRDPAIGWEPTPDQYELEQLVENANRWVRSQQKRVADWRPTKRIDSLPKSLREHQQVAPLLTDESLRLKRLSEADGRLLQQAIWLRDISIWAKRDALTDANVARQLFDWTIRNVQLASTDQAAIIHYPWQAVLYGYGSVEHRAWVFVELCRHQSLPAVFLATKANGDSPAEFWLPAVLIDGKWHLFDTTLGLPVPSGTLDTTATLSEVVANPAILATLASQESADVTKGAEGAYRVTAQQLTHVEPWIVASPLQLSASAELLEDMLEGEQYVTLTARVDKTVEQLEKFDTLSPPKLWAGPFQALVDQATIKSTKRIPAIRAFAPYASHPRLWKARVYHFQGHKQPSPHKRDSLLAEPRDGHSDAIATYQSKQLRKSNEQLSRLVPEEQALEIQTRALASYWLGLLSYDLGNYETAKYWLAEQTLGSQPTGWLRQAAKYNLARTYEKLDDPRQASGLLKTCGTGSPQHAGNLIRAQRLLESENPSTEGSSPENPADDNP